MNAYIQFEDVFDPSQADLAHIDRGLHNHNLDRLGEETLYNYHKVAVIARGADGLIVGGIHGEMFSDWLHIDTFWVDQKHRGRGIGSRLLQRIEQIAVAKGFHGSHLETTSYQAIEFYLKRGYTIFGELEGKPAGSTWYYIKKNLAQVTIRLSG